MSFLDMFKKPSKKQPLRVQDDALLSTEMQKKRFEAAREFLDLLQGSFSASGREMHAGTVLSTVARLAGTSLFRSMDYKQDIKPGVVVLSDEVNEAWPQLLNQFAFFCKQNGIDVMSKPLVTEFPDQDKPRLDVAQVQHEFQDLYNQVMKKHGLDYLNSARAGMVACAILVHYLCTKVMDIDPQVATGIVAMGVVEGAKTAPPPLGSGGAMSEKKEENANRLVLGERDAAIQDALDHGGIFIDPHPEILQTLQAGGIDPYLVYEQGMLAQIEKRIPRIDFVQAEVDRLLEEWKSKPEANAPIHVRQILWLKKNAATHGYDQQGNSWVRK